MTLALLLLLLALPPPPLLLSMTCLSVSFTLSLSLSLSLYIYIYTLRARVVEEVVAALMIVRAPENVTIGEQKQNKRCGEVRSAHTIAKMPAHVVKLHEVDTAFVSKTLLNLSSKVDDEMPRQEEHQYSHRSSQALFALPVDGRHLFVACGSETNSRNGASSVFVVRLHQSGPPTSARSVLPVAAISGCVQDGVGVLCLTGIVESSVAVGGDEEKEERRRCYTTGASAESSPFIPPPVLGSHSNLNLAVPGADDAGEKEGTRSEERLSETASRAPTRIHSFLLTDAVMHAIWAVEVDMDSLKVRVTSPCHYWSRRSGKNNSDTAGAEASQQQKSSACATEAKVLIGGKQGFLDGPFHEARFTSPSAMCWRIDDVVAEDDAMEPNVKMTTIMSGHSTRRYDLLFVSDAGNHAIRYVNFCSKLVRTVSGVGGVPGYRDGAYHVSRLQEAAAMVWCSSYGLLFVDRPNGAVRLVTGLEENKAVGNDVVQGSSLSPRVWTVSGGLYSAMGPYIDAVEVQKASLGTPSALAPLPNGSGILFADSQYHALRVLSSQGVETLLGPCDCSGHTSFSSGLIACTHLVACRLLSPGLTPRVAFLVSSGVNQTVSLLVPCSHMEMEGSGSPLDLAHLSAMHIVPVQCAKLTKGVLRKYKRGSGKLADQQEVKNASSKNISHGHKKLNSSSGSRTTPLSLRQHVSLKIHTSPTAAAASSRLKEVEQQVLKMYLRYAGRTPLHYRVSSDGCCGSRWHPCDVNMTHSLSLLSFWRLLIHSGYFATRLPLQLSPSSPSADAAAGDTVPSMTVRNDCYHIQCRLQDWRIITEVLHRMSVKQHGYHILSVMSFKFFCRVIFLLHSWKHYGVSESAVGTDDVQWQVGLSSDVLGERELLVAYEDAVRKVEALNLHLLQAVHATLEEEQGPGRENVEERFSAADALLRLLVCNEKPLHQLFHAYCKTVVVQAGSSSCEAGCREHVGTMCNLRKMTTSDDERYHESLNFLSTITYSGFHALFHAVDVFPTLISESLLQRAFDDAFSNPLFHHLTRDSAATSMMQEQERPQNGVSFDIPVSHMLGSKSACGGTALPFLTFVEAFIRVALTTFSLCGERDRFMYPTAVAKVEALMRWINRSFDINSSRERAAFCREGGIRCGNQTSPLAATRFPLNFVFFTTSVRKTEQ